MIDYSRKLIKETVYLKDLDLTYRSYTVLELIDELKSVSGIDDISKLSIRCEDSYDCSSRHYVEFEREEYDEEYNKRIEKLIRNSKNLEAQAQLKEQKRLEHIQKEKNKLLEMMEKYPEVVEEALLNKDKPV